MYLLLFLRIFFYVAFLHVFFFFVSDAAGIEFDRGALEHGSALDDATVEIGRASCRERVFDIV